MNGKDLQMSAAAGAVGGVLGAVAMGFVMAYGQKAGIMEPPPLTIERELERQAGVAEKTGREEEYALATAEHLALGAGLGAGFGLARESLGLRGPAAGAAYGLALYVLLYAGVGPALRLIAGPWKNDPATIGLRAFMHLIFGVVTATVSEMLLAGRRQAGTWPRGAPGL